MSARDDTAKITHEEMIELFGEEMPIEAVSLLWGASDGETIGNVRRKLREMAGARAGTRSLRAAQEKIAWALIELEPITKKAADRYASAILAALTAGGYRIVGPDEVDPVTLEKCAEVAANWGSEIPAEIRALGRKV